MSYRLASSGSDRFQLILENEPEFISALPMAPSRLETELLRGQWLLLVFAVWSTADIQAIQTAINFVKQRKDQLKLGIRPFHSHDELNLWLPESHLPTYSSTTISERNRGTTREVLMSSDKSRHPIWLLLKNGQLSRESAGSLTQESLEDFVRLQSRNT